MIRLRRHRAGSSEVIDALRTIADGLRAGRSLRQAVVGAAAAPGSPLAPVAAALASGRPLVASLRSAAAEGGDADWSSVLCILAVHAEAGGDPLPATSELAGRLAARAAARQEARALATQARLGARALLLLTPAFLLLVVATDPGGALQWMAESRPRIAVLSGLGLQALGALWIGAIVRNAVGPRKAVADIPVLRAVRALVAGRARPATDGEVADVAETMSFALDAGLAPSAAAAAVAPYATGRFGEALRTAVADVASVPHEALTRAVAHLDGVAVKRFAGAYTSSMTLGVPLAPALRSLADEVRRQISVHFAEDARRASIRVLIPLGLLVLPAFVLACLVPLFVGGLQGISG